MIATNAYAAHRPPVLPHIVAVIPRHVAGRAGARRHSTAVYVRRRIVAALGALTFVAIGATSIGGFAGASDDLAVRGARVQSGATVVTYVAQPGDTMWSISERFVPSGADRAEYVNRLVQLNGGASLAVGQLVRLP